MKSRLATFGTSLLLLGASAAIAWLLHQKPLKQDERTLIVRLKPKKGKGHITDTLTIFNGDTLFWTDGDTIEHSADRVTYSEQP